MAVLARKGWGFGATLMAAWLFVVSPLKAQAPPGAAPPPAPPAPAYQYPQPSPLRLTLRGSQPDLSYRVRLWRNEDESEDERQLVGWCTGDCHLVLWPGKYQLRVDPPDGSGLRRARRDVELQRDTSVYVEPGKRAQHGWGLGLTIAGGSILGLGVAVMAMTGGLERSDTLEQIGVLSVIGVGAIATAGGITLLVMGRNRITIDPPPVRTAGSTPVMLSLRSQL